jgi:hypothetical protein
MNDLTEFMDQFFNVKNCGVCKEPVQVEIKETSRSVKIIARHFCKVMNGSCKVERTYRKKLDE